MRIEAHPALSRALRLEWLGRRAHGLGVICAVAFAAWAGQPMACEEVSRPGGQPDVPEGVYLVSYPLQQSEDLDDGTLRFVVEEVLRGPDLATFQIRASRGEARHPQTGHTYYVGVWRGASEVQNVYVGGCWPFFIPEADVSHHEVLRMLDKLYEGQSE